MQIRFFQILFVVTCFSWPASAQTSAPVGNILTAALEGYVRPAYKFLVEETGRLSAAAKTLCEAPSDSNLTAAQTAFKASALAWSKVEWFRVGAAMSDNRIERMLYFPDRKSTGLKQVQRALLNQDQNAANVETLITKSVAMQGLGASEFLLFGDGSETLVNSTGIYRCTYVLASAQTISAIAADLQSGWIESSDAAQFWQKPAANNPYFRNDTEALNMLIGTLIHGLEAVRDVRLGAFLGKTAESDKPKLAPYWRSETTFASIAANLEGFQTLYTYSRLVTALPAGNAELIRTIEFDFGQAIRTAKSLDTPVASVLSDTDLRRKATYLKLTVQILIDHFNVEFAPAAGLAAGFSFGDGD